MQPFWQTITPLIFATACTLTLSYVLFFATILARKQRPWLQRGAALSAMIALTLVADLMYIELEAQHNRGGQYSYTDLRNVRTRTALKVVRLISNTLLWFAQVQVLIRLFPRHRDKIVIKWTGLGIIILEVVFAVLNDFYHPSPVNPNSTNAMVPAIPVLAYLFQIALGVLYAGCVLFYTFASGRWRHAYAIRNAIIAALSLIAILMPIVFFCLDIWSPRVKGWGDYVRWVSSVGAVVIVWDWVDRIEDSIERDTKVGVLGREVFEDEMNDTKKKGKGVSFKSSRLRWKRTTNSESDNEPAIELPTIHHPLVRSVQSTTRSTTSISSQTLRSGSRVPVLDARRDLAEEHARQSQYAASQRSRPREEPPIPEHFLQPDTADFVHTGFSSGDYWQDEKEAPA